MRKRKSSPPVLATRSPDNDPALVQALVNRRIAFRLGVSLPVAAVVASLAGLGPNVGRTGR